MSVQVSFWFGYHGPEAIGSLARFKEFIPRFFTAETDNFMVIEDRVTKTAEKKYADLFDKLRDYERAIVNLKGYRGVDPHPRVQYFLALGRILSELRANIRFTIRLASLRTAAYEELGRLDGRLSREETRLDDAWRRRDLASAVACERARVKIFVRITRLRQDELLLQVRQLVTPRPASFNRRILIAFGGGHYLLGRRAKRLLGNRNDVQIDTTIRDKTMFFSPDSILMLKILKGMDQNEALDDLSCARSAFSVFVRDHLLTHMHHEQAIRLTTQLASRVTRDEISEYMGMSDPEAKAFVFNRLGISST